MVDASHASWFNGCAGFKQLFTWLKGSKVIQISKFINLRVTLFPPHNVQKIKDDHSESTNLVNKAFSTKSALKLKHEMSQTATSTDCLPTSILTNSPLFELPSLSSGKNATKGREPSDSLRTSNKSSPVPSLFPSSGESSSGPTFFHTSYPAKSYPTFISSLSSTPTFTLVAGGC